MNAFTPGPWHRNIKAGGRYPTVFAGRNQHVATVSQQNNPEETEANISLIAAAPDLLELVREALEGTKPEFAFRVRAILDRIDGAHRCGVNPPLVLDGNPCPNCGAEDK